MNEKIYDMSFLKIIKPQKIKIDNIPAICRKKTAVALAVALELSLDETDDLFGVGGLCSFA
jgi:hypothetical protein